MIFRAPLFGQFMRFALVGVIGTGAHYLVMALLIVLGLHSTAATSIGAVVGALLNYALNYRFTFRSEQDHARALTKFMLVASVGWGLNALFFHGFHFLLNWPLWIAQVMTTGLVLIWNFAANRWWTFGESRHG